MGTNLPVVGTAKECLRIMSKNGVDSTRATFVSILADKLHPIGKLWSQKTSKLPNPNDIKSRTKHAGKLYFQPLPTVPTEIMAFSSDAVRFESKNRDVKKQWNAADGPPDASDSLLSIAYLLQTMSECSESINREVLATFKNRYEIAMSYCLRDTRMAALIKSFPTNYLSSSAKALDEEMKTQANCRSATLEMQSKIGAMRTIDELCDVLASLSSEARSESPSQEIDTKYDAIQDEIRSVDFDKFEEGTDWFRVDMWHI